MSVTAADLGNNKLIFINLSTLFYNKAHHAGISKLKKSAVFCDWGDIRMMYDVCMLIIVSSRNG